ncbi:branched-chain amino acid ABC transporter permease [Caldovatus sediminis]|uniref:Branched-chain amino acid ABC transporter permease n=2 Tax=Caldovatus sediminis TaxID=2041189 RepID=A0A8J2ZBS3_9PROT|nr:branched-chain amino acid ABC transporter permease [Caldovatus sediminis]
MEARSPSRWGAQEWAAVAMFLAVLAVPWATDDLLVQSIVNRVLIGAMAALSVFIMLRMDLLSFATPAFMALGGYAAVLLTMHGVTEVLLIVPASFLVPALVALPLGALVLRLRGVYFVLVTFVLTEILQLVLFMTPRLTGGADGLAGFPAPTLLGTELSDARSVLALAAAMALLAAVITAALTAHFRQHFAAIEENEVLAESLGLVVWRYKAMGFVVAAGIAGMAGFSLGNMLLTVHPTSFGAQQAVDTIVYAIIGGRGSILGPIAGASLLVTVSDFLGNQGQYAQGLFGLLLILVTLVARGGIAGAVAALARRLRAPRAAAGPAAAAPEAARGGA